MWSLVLVFYFLSGYGGGVGATTVDNFTSKEACEVAGNAFVNNLNTYQYNWISKGLLSNKKEISIETNNQSNIGKSYQCIEVK